MPTTFVIDFSCVLPLGTEQRLLDEDEREAMAQGDALVKEAQEVDDP